MQLERSLSSGREQLMKRNTLSRTIRLNPDVRLRLTCAFSNAYIHCLLAIMSRALFSHIIPIVLRHYYNPFQLKDTPAIREDDTPAVSLANWRLAYGNASQKQQNSNGHHSSEKVAKSAWPKQTKLAYRLLWHFRRLFALQVVRTWRSHQGRETRLSVSFLSKRPVLVSLGSFLFFFLAFRSTSISKVRGRSQVYRSNHRWQDTCTCRSILCLLNGYRSGKLLIMDQLRSFFKLTCVAVSVDLSVDKSISNLEHWSQGAFAGSTLCRNANKANPFVLALDLYPHEICYRGGDLLQSSPSARHVRKDRSRFAKSWR